MILSLNDGPNGDFITNLQYGLTKWANPYCRSITSFIYSKSREQFYPVYNPLSFISYTHFIYRRPTYTCMLATIYATAGQHTRVRCPAVNKSDKEKIRLSYLRSPNGKARNWC